MKEFETRPTIFSILMGTHPYSLDPEDETGWCRVCLLYGAIFGTLFGVWIGAR